MADPIINLTVDNNNGHPLLKWTQSDTTVSYKYTLQWAPHTTDNNNIWQTVQENIVSGNDPNYTYIDNKMNDNDVPKFDTNNLSSISVSPNSENNLQFNIALNQFKDDTGRWGYYRIVATNSTNTSLVYYSNSAIVNIISGMKGISYEVNSNPNTPTVFKYTEIPSTNLNVKFTADIDSSDTTYVHIAYLDNNNNTGLESIFPVSTPHPKLQDTFKINNYDSIKQGDVYNTNSLSYTGIAVVDNSGKAFSGNTKFDISLYEEKYNTVIKSVSSQTVPNNLLLDVASPGTSYYLKVKVSSNLNLNLGYAASPAFTISRNPSNKNAIPMLMDDGHFISTNIISDGEQLALYAVSKKVMNKNSRVYYRYRDAIADPQGKQLFTNDDDNYDIRVDQDQINQSKFSDFVALNCSYDDISQNIIIINLKDISSISNGHKIFQFKIECVCDDANFNSTDISTSKIEIPTIDSPYTDTLMTAARFPMEGIAQEYDYTKLSDVYIHTETPTVTIGDSPIVNLTNNGTSSWNVGNKSAATYDNITALTDGVMTYYDQLVPNLDSSLNNSYTHSLSSDLLNIIKLSKASGELDPNQGYGTALVQNLYADPNSNNTIADNNGFIVGTYQTTDPDENGNPSKDIINTLTYNTYKDGLPLKINNEVKVYICYKYNGKSYKQLLINDYPILKPLDLQLPLFKENAVGDPNNLGDLKDTVTVNKADLSSHSYENIKSISFDIKPADTFMSNIPLQITLNGNSFDGSTVIVSNDDYDGSSIPLQTYTSGFPVFDGHYNGNYTVTANEYLNFNDGKTNLNLVGPVYVFTFDVSNFVNPADYTVISPNEGFNKIDNNTTDWLVSTNITEDDFDKYYKYELSVSFNGQAYTTATYTKSLDSNNKVVLTVRTTGKGSYQGLVKYNRTYPPEAPDGQDTSTYTDEYSWIISNESGNYTPPAGGDDANIPAPQDFGYHDSYSNDINSRYNDAWFKSTSADVFKNFDQTKNQIRIMDFDGQEIAISPSMKYPIFANNKVTFRYYSANSMGNGVDKVHDIRNAGDQPSDGYSTTKISGDYFTNITSNDRTNQSQGNRNVQLGDMDQTSIPNKPVITLSSDTPLNPFTPNENLTVKVANDITFGCTDESKFYDCQYYIDGNSYTLGTKFTKNGYHVFTAVFNDKHNYKVNYTIQNFQIEPKFLYTPPYIDYNPKKYYSSKFNISINYNFFDGDLDDVKECLYKTNINDQWKEYTTDFDITTSCTIYARKLFNDGFYLDAQETIDLTDGFNDQVPDNPDISDIGTPQLNGGNSSIYIPTVYKKLGYKYDEYINGLPYTPMQPITNYERSIRHFEYKVVVTNRMNWKSTTLVKDFTIDTVAPDRPELDQLVHGTIVNISPSYILNNAITNKDTDCDYVFSIDDNIVDGTKPLSTYVTLEYNRAYKIIVQAIKKSNQMANTAYFYVDIDTDSNVGKHDLVDGKINQLSSDRNVLIPFFRDNNNFEYPHELIINDRTADLYVVTDEPDGKGGYLLKSVTEDIMSMLKDNSNKIGDLFKISNLHNEQIRSLSYQLDYINNANNDISKLFNEISPEINRTKEDLDNLNASSTQNSNDIKAQMTNINNIVNLINGEFTNKFNLLNTSIRNQVPLIRNKFISEQKEFAKIESKIAVDMFNLNTIENVANNKVTQTRFKAFTDKIDNLFNEQKKYVNSL